MIITERTNSNYKIFRQLAAALNQELKLRDGDDHLFYAQLNKADTIQEEAVGCGAIREYSP